MKKMLAYLLICVMALTAVTGAFAEEAQQITYNYDEVSVAVTTPLTGNFFTSMWGNGSSDLDVRMLIHGYNLIEWDTKEGMFVPDDSVVSGATVRAELNGNYTFLLALQRDLYYSDGTPVTAWDYAFSMLLTMAPELKELGANVRAPEYIVGYKAYIEGRTKKLSGVRVLSDYMLSITIDKKYLPFFYELGMLDCTPYPASVIAPGVEVADDGDGIYLKNGNEFTAELLKGTILDEAAGYRTHPSLTTGAYVLTSYADGVAEFEINPWYKGNSKGNKPQIKKIRMVSMAADEMAQAYKDGKVTVLNKVTDMKTIADCLAVSTEENQLTYADYGRTGLSFISFNTDRAPLDDLAVRQAIAYVADRDDVAQEAVGEYGMKALGYFGEGQWMYLLLSGAESPVKEPAEDADEKEKEKYEKELEAWKEVSLDEIGAYERDAAKGAELLESAGWNLNESGEAFSSGTDKVRYKETEEGLVPLKLTLAYGQGSAAGKALEGALADSLREAGIDLTVSAIPGDQLLAQYYRSAESEYDMLFLGTNFDVLYDPSLNFSETEEGHYVWRTSGLEDDELYELAVDMRKTEPGDLLGYCTKWLAFQKRVMEQLPVLPVYTNMYYDFFPLVLHEYHVEDSISWPMTIIGAYMADYEPEEAAQEP